MLKRGKVRNVYGFTCSIMIFQRAGFVVNIVINSGENDVEVFCVALVKCKITIISKINEPSAKYGNFETNI